LDGDSHQVTTKRKIETKLKQSNFIKDKRAQSSNDGQIWQIMPDGWREEMSDVWMGG
jgi:hypothetical protein